MIGMGTPRGVARPSPGQVWPATAGCDLAAAGCGKLQPAVVRPSLAKLRSDLARCGWPCTFALV
jgi:hypothetical protein